MVCVRFHWRSVARERRMARGLWMVAGMELLADTTTSMRQRARNGTSETVYINRDDHSFPAFPSLACLGDIDWTMYVVFILNHLYSGHLKSFSLSPTL